MKAKRSKWEWLVLAAIVAGILGWACWFNARQNTRDRQEWEKMQAHQRRIQERNR